MKCLMPKEVQTVEIGTLHCAADNYQDKKERPVPLNVLVVETRA
jgi:hypothetical protein